MDLMLEHLGQGLWITLLLSMPCVLTAAAIGLVVGIIQAVTQVQEQTIAAAPKIICVFLVIILGGGMMMTVLTNYIRESVNIAFNEIPQDGVFILPPKVKAPNQMRAQAFFREQSGYKGDGKFKAFTGDQMSDEDKTQGLMLFNTSKAKTGNRLGMAENMTLQKAR